MTGDIRLPADDRLSDSEWNFPDKNCSE